MTSSRDDSLGSIAARNERGADRGAQSRRGASPDRAPREGALLRGALAARAVSYRDAGPSPQDRRLTTRRAADQPVPPAEAPSDAPVSGRPTFRLGEVYAEELERLRQQAHAEGFAAGHAEGLGAAEAVVAETERAAAERLAEVQARWERRLGAGAGAPGAAAPPPGGAAPPLAPGNP